MKRVRGESQTLNTTKGENGVVERKNNYWIFTDPNNGSFSTTKLDRIVYTGLFSFIVIIATLNGEIFKDVVLFSVLIGVLTGTAGAGMVKSYLEKKLANGNNGKTNTV